MAYYRIAPSWTALLLPLVVLVQLAFATGLGLLLAMGNLYYRDVRYLTGVMVTVWMFATSVVYPVERVGGRLGAVLALNPMTPIIDAYRALLLRGELPPLAPFAIASIVAFSTLAIGWIVFHRSEHRFAELV
jgi:ABC-type polysaccharide/polyol phosphate export permease